MEYRVDELQNSKSWLGAKKNGKNGMQWQSSRLPPPPVLQSLLDPAAAAESWPAAASPECVQSR